MSANDTADLHNAYQIMLNALLQALAENQPEVIEGLVSLVRQAVKTTPTLPKMTQDVLMRSASGFEKLIQDDDHRIRH